MRSSSKQSKRTACTALLNEWDPVLLLDGHLMSRVNHGYANTYGTTTVPAAAPGPRDYTHDTLFPAVREMVRKEFGLEVFTHALFGRGRHWPPTGVESRRAPPGRSKPSSSSTTTVCGTGSRSSPRRRASRRSNGASTRSTLHHGAARVHQRAREGDPGRRQGRRRQDGGGRAGARGIRPAQELAGWPVRVTRQDRCARLSRRTSRSTGRAPASSSTRPGRRQGRPRSSRASTTSRSRSARGTPSVPRGYLIPRRARRRSPPSCARTTFASTTLDKPMRVEGEAFGIKQMRKRAQRRLRHDGARRRVLAARDPRVSRRQLLRGHGAADGERRVLLPGAAGA